MQKPLDFSSSTVPGAELTEEQRQHLERDRWPEFERELYRRRLRKIRFSVYHQTMRKELWEWMICRCRNWNEVERVLNRHKVQWERKGREIEMDGLTVFRCQ